MIVVLFCVMYVKSCVLVWLMGLALYAITGGDGNILCSFQCLWLFMSSENTKTSLSGCCVLTFLLRASLSLNGMSFMWSMIWLCL